MRTMRALPDRHRAAGRGARAPFVCRQRRATYARSDAARRDRSGDARRLDLRIRSNGSKCRRIRAQTAGLLRSRDAGVIELTIDDATVRVPDGSTILDACNAAAIDTPTLCYLESLTPVNA